MGCYFLLEGSSQPKNQTCVSCLVRFFTTELPQKSANPLTLASLKQWTLYLCIWQWEENLTIGTCRLAQTHKSTLFFKLTFHERFYSRQHDTILEADFRQSYIRDHLIYPVSGHRNQPHKKKKKKKEKKSLHSILNVKSEGFTKFLLLEIQKVFQVTVCYLIHTQSPVH